MHTGQIIARQEHKYIQMHVVTSNDTHLDVAVARQRWDWLKLKKCAVFICQMWHPTDSRANQNHHRC